MPFANVAGIIDSEHVGEHMLETQEHVGKLSGNPLLIYRQCGGNTLGIKETENLIFPNSNSKRNKKLGHLDSMQNLLIR